MGEVVFTSFGLDGQFVRITFDQSGYAVYTSLRPDVSRHLSLSLRDVPMVQWFEHCTASLQLLSSNPARTRDCGMCFVVTEPSLGQMSQVRLALRLTNSYQIPTYHHLCPDPERTVTDIRMVNTDISCIVMFCRTLSIDNNV